MTKNTNRMTPAARRALHIRRAARRVWQTLPAAAAVTLAGIGFFALCLLILETI